MNESINIVQLQLAGQDYELRAQGDALVSITCHNEFRHLYCIAGIAEHRYRLEKVGMLNPKIIITDQDTKTQIGNYIYKRFGKPSLVSVEGHNFKVHTSKKFFKGPNCEWINGLGESIISYSVGSGVPKISADRIIKVRQDICSSQTGLLILALAFYDYKIRSDRRA